MFRMFNSLLVLSLAVVVLSLAHQLAPADARLDHFRIKREGGAKPPTPAQHHLMMHTHMSRKVFDRACAASKDVIDEIILCVTNNKELMKHLKFNSAAECHKEAFGTEFNDKDWSKHRDEICKQRDKFETMIACVYERISANSTAQEMQELTEGMVDVGLCIVNALDG